MPIRRCILHALAFSTLVALPACNFQKLAVDSTSEILLRGSVAMDREADMALAREAFPASLKTLETFLITSPENPNLLLLLARGYNSYAFGFVEGDLDEAKLVGTQEQIDELTRRAKILYNRGSAYGWRLLERPVLEAAAKKGDLDAVDVELGKLEAKDAPALFWAGYGWASVVNLSLDDPDTVSALPVVEKLMKKVYDLDPGYNAGAATVFQGVLNASKPVAFGGKPDVAKKYFDEAISKYPENLLHVFLYARFYCAQTQDAKLFEELLRKVADADVTKYPELRLTNEIARDRSRFWSKHVQEIIL